ncbi:hypothetical protein [Pollutibacter soli]|uniref:hypothetical protein n=1 Tax=Pollutibacter soli TaxID=3034157 RepID=UPI0030134D1B
MNRKNFIAAGTTALAAAILHSNELQAQQQEVPPYNIAIVKEFVIAGHGNMDKVKEMVVNSPNLLYCRYDWGSGDFEEAIEGAGHVGNKDIANFLISQGARPNIFVLTMLGETEIVKAMLTKYPALLRAKGAHGLTLLHHATKGGEQSKEILEFLKEKGLTEMQIRIK